MSSQQRMSEVERGERRDQQKIWNSQQTKKKPGFAALLKVRQPQYHFSFVLILLHCRFVGSSHSQLFNNIQNEFLAGGSIPFFLFFVHKHFLFFLQYRIKHMDPPEQVDFLISTLSKGENIIPLERGLNDCYKTYTDFISMKNHMVFKNQQLISLVLKRLESTNMEELAPILNLVRLIGRIGKRTFFIFLFFFSSLLIFFPPFFFVWTIFQTEENQLTFREQGAIEKVVKVMETYPDHVGIQEKGCGAFQNLVLDGVALVLLSTLQRRKEK
jgi:hypothetical protein